VDGKRNSASHAPIDVGRNAWNALLSSSASRVYVFTGDARIDHEALASRANSSTLDSHFSVCHLWCDPPDEQRQFPSDDKQFQKLLAASAAVHDLETHCHYGRRGQPQLSPLRPSDKGARSNN